MKRTALAACLLAAAATILTATGAAAFEPAADPRGVFTCLDGEPVPGHPAFPGIVTGVEKSFVNTGGTAAAAWSATSLFGGPLDPC